MNMHYPAPVQTNRSILWLLAAALLVASLSLALQKIGQPVFATVDHSAARIEVLAVPQPVPVPEPAQSQPAPAAQMSVTPAPAGAPDRPAPQPVPTPRAGQ